MPAHTQPARGMRDFLPEDVRRRQYVIDVVRRVYERYGFEPLETPTLENIETLTGKYGDEGNQLIFKVLRRGEHGGETDLALRYDLTVPLARVVAEHRGRLPKFFKRYQIQPVWRADRPARGRFREFYQCDVDVIGSTSPVIEVELCSAVSDVLRELGFTQFLLRLNHRGILRGMLDNLGVPATLHDQALVALDKRDKIGADGVRKELAARGVPDAAAERLVGAFGPLGADGDLAQVNEERLRRVREHVGAEAEGIAGVDTLTEILRLARQTSAATHLIVDTSLARGLSYYTGAIMEIAVEGIGSLGGGGRYDGLIGMFSGEQIPACGFSLGLERMLVVMAERNMFPPTVQAGGPDVMVTIFDSASIEESLRLAEELRAAGLRTELYPEPDKLGKQFKYASARDAAFVAVVGADERARGEVTIKNMKTGDQRSIPRSDVAGHLGRLRPAPGVRSADSGSRTPDPEESTHSR
jgi:histidyl-tRNA synthetase